MKTLHLQQIIFYTLVLFLLLGCGGSSEQDPPPNETANAKPIAKAGEQQNISTGIVVTLNGSTSSDANGDTLSYQWAFTSMPTNSSAELNNATTASPTFTADVEGTYTLQLIVNDQKLDSNADTVSIIVTTANEAPIAEAGNDQNVSTGTLVTLNGDASSDADGDSLTYQWSLTSSPTNSQATFDDSTLVSAKFTADIDGTYTAQLIVNDGISNSSPDLLTIIAVSNNSKPVANAGDDQPVSTGATVTLNGIASSDADGDGLTYHWVLTDRPLNSSATLDSASSPTPTFVADMIGLYIVQLIVNDGTQDSDPYHVQIVASSFNVAPIANAGNDQHVALDSRVTLEGNASTDANGDMLSFAWSFTSKPEGSNATLDSPQTNNPSFVADISGQYVISLIVGDSTLASLPDSVQITAADGALKLFIKNKGKFYNEIPLTSAIVRQINLVGTDTPTKARLGSYKLSAFGQDVTISNLTAIDNNAISSAYFTGIEEGYQLAAGTEVIFHLEAMVSTEQLNLAFSFDVPETGGSFYAEYLVGGPQPLVKIAPQYPAQAARDGTEGWVKLGFTINEVGGVEDVAVIDASPKRVFDREARRALGKWKFKPLVIDGQPLKQFDIQAIIEFKLDD